MIIHCPFCHGAIDAPDTAAGQLGSCPHCVQNFTVPNIAPPPVSQPPPASTPPPPSKQSRRVIVLHALRTNPAAQLCAIALLFLIGWGVWSIYTGYRERIAAEKAKAERIERIAHNTPIIWGEYRAIQTQSAATLSLDEVQSVRIKGDKMRKLLEYDIDRDLYNHIQARVRLIDAGLSIWNEAITEAKKLETRRNVNSFLAGMVGGILSPDDPVGTGAAFGQAAYASGQNEATSLAARIKEATQALQLEDKKLDEYEPTLLKLLSARYQ